MYIGLHVKYPLFVSDFNEAWIFVSIVFNDNLSGGTELFHADEWKDRGPYSHNEASSHLQFCKHT